MWSQWPCVSSTRRTPSRWHSSSSRSCSLAASSSTASPVSVQRSTKTLLSTGPTTTWWISIPVASQISVSAMLTSVCVGDLDALDRRILAIAVPALGSLLVEPIYVLTDTAVVGRLGTDELGGLALALHGAQHARLRLQLPLLRHDGAGGRAAGPGRPGGRRPPTPSRRSGSPPASGSSSRRRGARPRARWSTCSATTRRSIDHGVTYLRISTVGIPFQLVTIACIGYLYGLPDTRRPFLVLAAVDLAQPRASSWCSCSASTGASRAARWGTVLAQVLERRRAARPSSCPGSGPTGCTACASCRR